MTAHAFPKLVLFDLDGTLLDSAPDMLATVNRMRAARGRAPMPLHELRPHVSKGSRAMSAAAFPELGGEVPAELIREFLDTYEGELGRHSLLFDGVAELLDAIEAAGSRWGIVTNKPEYLAVQVMPALGWDTRSAILVGGDTLPERKPHPLPLLHSAEQLGVAIGDCAYVGDDQRDIASARAAGMRSVVALWGYRRDDDDPRDWGGDALADRVHDLLDPGLWASLR
ncbi:phosphoglycolate phosphatase [Thermomonas sp.]|jgi:phosphoglycolate phosphatase|uniref:phosphoglycolate phosphatase n=1 Tax=Thermomonas sp. TaxID=1971895 RepID=UPI001B4D1DD9|nr:phosphoglycolate phosphatase [Thermomonas sp.]MBK6332213.1 phosphoglycolate phosphatase [Thermomonas sp.]MBK6417175.1 phosphoglycolate phosphatase [Thermomonas sp.]MBK6924404.1 phosphoglycolate phosphatase [Thermomonas sp.]MBK7204543.1 phosphoglycolate phosphatase [Thermomonas sp.]MBK9668528.1 phosphoglycolate phosphatase [Thermomonas sp.]